MGISIVTPPASEPISLAEFKLAARVTNTAEDTLITDIIIPGARQKFERDTRRQIITATYDFFLCDFPSSRAIIEIPRPPLASVTTIKYIDADGVQQTIGSGDYTVDVATEPGAVYPNFNVDWPVTRELLRNAVEIRFIAGVATSAVELDDKNAILLLALHWFENRESVVIDERIATAEVPLGYQTIVNARDITEYQ